MLVLVSGDLTNEALYTAQRLAREGLATHGVDSTVRADLPGGPETWSRLFALPVSLGAVATADVVIVAGLDPRYSFSVAGVQVRRALRRGARLVTVDARETSLTRVAGHDLRPRPGDEAADARPAPPDGPSQKAATGCPASGRARCGGRGGGASAGPGDRARTARRSTAPDADALLAELEALGSLPGVTVVPLTWPPTRAAPSSSEPLAGRCRARAGSAPAARRLDLAAVRTGRAPAVLYLIGETPFTERPPCDYLIAQDLYPPPFPVDAFLPAASFAEADGTLTNLEGRVQDLRPVERPAPGAHRDGPRPDWAILSGIADRLGRAGPHLRGRRRGASRRSAPSCPASRARRPGADGA